MPVRAAGAAGQLASNFVRGLRADEDEADPAHVSISYFSPIAQALIGRELDVGQASA